MSSRRFEKDERKRQRAKAPIDLAMDQVDWQPLADPDPATLAEGLPYATHEGTLHIGESSFKAYQLSDGRRVLDANDVGAFFS